MAGKLIGFAEGEGGTVKVFDDLSFEISNGAPVNLLMVTARTMGKAQVASQAEGNPPNYALRMFSEQGFKVTLIPQKSAESVDTGILN